jgi:indole-3-glycerol phosphate synthase
VDSLLYLKEHGFNGFLMGEYFMKQADPAEAFAAFCHELRENKKTSHQ